MLSGTANRFFFPPEFCVKMFTAPNQVAYYKEFIASKNLTKAGITRCLFIDTTLGCNQKAIPYFSTGILALIPTQIAGRK